MKFTHPKIPSSGIEYLPTVVQPSTLLPEHPIAPKGSHGLISNLPHPAPPAPGQARAPLPSVDEPVLDVSHTWAHTTWPLVSGSLPARRVGAPRSCSRPGEVRVRGGRVHRWARACAVDACVFLIHPLTFGQFPRFGCCERRCRERVCAEICSRSHLPPLWVDSQESNPGAAPTWRTGCV